MITDLYPLMNLIKRNCHSPKEGLSMYDLMQLWRSIKERCRTRKAYEDCEMCEEWKQDSKAFCKWAIDNLYQCNGEHLQIDKDLLGNGKKTYSPETCCFLPATINSMLVTNRDKLRVLPVGVSILKNGKYMATIRHQDGCLTKTFDNIEEAREFYRTNKKKYILKAANAYKQWLPEHIYNTLLSYEIS